MSTLCFAPLLRGRRVPAPLRLSAERGFLREFCKKVVKRLGFALTDFVPENLKTKMQGTPVGAWICNFWPVPTQKCDPESPTVAL